MFVNLNGKMVLDPSNFLIARPAWLTRRARTPSLLLTLALVAGLCLLAGCKGTDSAKGQSNGSKETRKVKTTAVTQIPVGRSVSVTGTLLAFDQAVVSTKIPGRVGSINVDLGSVVQKGQVVATLEDRDYRLKVEQATAALSQARARLGLALDGSDDRVDATKTATVMQAQAALDQARQTLNRDKTLVAEGVVSREEYEAAVAVEKVAAGKYQDALEEIRNRQGVVAQRRSELDMAKQQLADTVVYSPFSGRVEEKRASMGEFVGAGTPLLNLVRVDPLRFRAEVPERDSVEVRQGQNIRVTIEGAPANYSGRITRIAPAISQQNRVLVIEADVANDGTLRPGSFAHGDIVTDDTQQAITIPPNALVVFAGIEKVIVIKDGKAVEKPVTTGRRGDGWIEIVAGVNVGEQVIVDPGNLQTGQPVATE